MTPFTFILCSLAVWRLCHLIAYEDGPFDIIYKIRISLKPIMYPDRWLAKGGVLGHLMDCPFCMSIWIAMPFTIAFTQKYYLLHWIALSGAACIIETITRKVEKYGEISS